MLMQMRTPVAKVLTFVLFGLLILSFAVWGIGDIFRATSGGNNVLEVDSIEVGQAEFERSLRQELNRLQSNFGGQIDFATARQLGIVEQTLQQLVNRALFDREADELRMLVTPGQIKQQIAGERAFQDQFGDFDPQRFNNVLRTMGLSEAGYVFTISRDLNRARIADAVSGVAVAPRKLTEQLFFYGEERRVAEVLEIDRDGFTDIPAASEEDLVKLHEELSDQFMSPETHEITLLQLRAVDMASNIAVSEEDIADAFENRRDEFGVPERRDIEQIVLPSEEEALAAKAKAEGGMAFEAVAQEAIGSAPIPLGDVTRGELAAQLPELADTVFEAEANAVPDPVESGFGWHLVHIKSVTEGKEPSLAEVSGTIREELARERAVDTLVTEANRIDDELAGGATLEQAATALDLDARKIPAIDAQGRDAEGQAIESLPPLDDLLPVLRGTAVGEASLLTETPDGDYFVLRVDGVTPSELQPLETVRAEVEAAWERRERDRLAQERAEALAARAKEGVALGKIAEDEGLELYVRGPVDRFGQGDAVQMSRDLASRMFEMKPGEVETLAGDDGWLVARLADIDRPDPAAEAEALDTVGQRVAQSMNGDLLNSFSAALRQDAEITVNNTLLESLIARY